MSNQKRKYQLQCIESSKGGPYRGDITFNILGIEGILASFTAKYFNRYELIKFEDNCLMTDFEFESRFFKTYSLSIDSTLNEFVQIAFCKVLHYCFDYRFSTLEIPADFMQRHQIKLLDYRPYVVGNKYYFVKDREADPLLEWYQDYIKTYDCTLLIQDVNNRYVSNKCTSNIAAIKKAMKSEDKLWNGIDAILGVIMEYVPGTIMEFQRQCYIVKNGKQITIYFDFPITFLSLPVDAIYDIHCIPFKLRINGTNITGPEFFFSNDREANHEFRLNKYADSRIVHLHPVLVYNKLQTLYGYDRYGERHGDRYYTSFKDNIETSDLEIIDVRDDDGDRELMDALVERLDEERDEDQDDEY